MLIDWFTVGAQALNFVFLVWLMKRFLYRPILHAIDAREERVARELADADAKRAEAAREREEFRFKSEEFDRQRAARLRQLTDEVRVERQRLLDEARTAADVLSAKRRETLRNEAENLNEAIGRRIQKEVFAIARKVLADLATTSLEDRVGEVFIRRLRELEGEAKEGLATALKGGAEPVVVRSAFDLPAGQRTAIHDALREVFAAENPVRFETAPGLVSGIELATNGQKVAWSIGEYLSAMEKGVGELLSRQGKPESWPDGESGPRAVAGGQ